jgi:hypothetical protein
MYSMSSQQRVGVFRDAADAERWLATGMDS